MHTYMHTHTTCWDTNLCAGSCSVAASSASIHVVRQNRKPILYQPLSPSAPPAAHAVVLFAMTGHAGVLVDEIIGHAASARSSL